MSDDGSSSAYSFPSDEEGYDPLVCLSDPEPAAAEEDEGKDEDVEMEAPPAAGELDLEAFRYDWRREVSNTQRAIRTRDRASFPPGPVAAVLLNTDLLQLILAPLKRKDLCALSLTCAFFREAAQAILFRTVTVPSFGAAALLSSLFSSNPTLATYVRHAYLSLAHPLETAADVEPIASLVQRQRAKQDQQHNEYFGKPGRPTVVCREWEYTLRRNLPLGADREDERILAAARRYGLAEWALAHHVQKKQEEADRAANSGAARTEAAVRLENGELPTAAVVEEQQRQRQAAQERRQAKARELRRPLYDVLSQRFSQWPFAHWEQPNPALSSLLDFLAPHLTHLVLTPPLSHYFSTFSSAVSSFASLSSLEIRGNWSRTLRFDNELSDRRHGSLTKLVHLPLPVLDLFPDGSGIVGVPPSVTRLVLDSVLLTWRKDDLEVPANGGSKPTGGASAEVDEQPKEGHESIVKMEEKSWGVEELALRRVVVKRRANKRQRTQPKPLKLSEEDLPHLPHGDARDPLLLPDELAYLSLDGFSGLSSHLTSLLLIDVDGVVPSSISAAVYAAASSLRHLTLHNLNLGAVAGAAVRTDGLYFSSRVEVVLVDFPLTAASARMSVIPTDRGRQLSDLEMAASRWWQFETGTLPSPKPARPPPPASSSSSEQRELDLPAALSRCSNLLTLHLDASLQLASNVPFFSPRVVDALLEARPPLQVLKLRLGAEGPTPREGFLSRREWEEVARKVEEVGEWPTLRLGESVVEAKLRVAVRESVQVGPVA
ncbi:hypothetical protein JCM8097_007567 [Rhodosporidiobolus ruineniae]